MLGVFSRAAYDVEECEWQADVYRWAIDQLGADGFFQDRPLVLPTADWFTTAEGAAPDERARILFEDVKRLTGLEAWPCRLIAQDPDPNPVIGEAFVVQNTPRGPGGTFCVETDDETPTITYQPAFLARPEKLIRVFAHELAHYLMATTPKPPPGGDEAMEHATDIVTIFLGFGVFVANTAFNFAQHQDVMTPGWSVERLGYVSEDEAILAIALFLIHTRRAPMATRPHLKPGLQKRLERVYRALAKTDGAANLAAG